LVDFIEYNEDEKVP